MSTTIFEYPPPEGGSASVSTVQGEGTAGTPTGGVLTIQGDPSGTPVPIAGSITATNASIGVTGAAVPADATYVGYNVSGNLTGATGTSSGLNTVVAAALPAGSAIIGNVRIDQTTPGTTNGVQVNAALPAGANTIGNVGIVAGSAIIGNVRIDQTTPGTTNGVQVNAALPAGTNKIGALTTVDTVTAVTTVSTVTAVTTVATVSSVAAIAPVTTTTAVFQAEGAVAFGSITNSYVTLFTPSAATKVLMMRNNMNAAVSVSMDAGSTTNFTLDAGDQMNIDLLANALNMGATAIQVKYAVGAPTSGSFRINGAH